MRRLCYILLMISCLLFAKTAHCQEVRDSVKIYFRQGHSTIDTSINKNRIALNRIADSLTTNYSDSLYRLSKVTIIGSASPEGSIMYNKRLSEKRANNLLIYLSRFGSLSASDKKFIYLGRNWKGLLQLVKCDVNVPYRNDVIALLEDIVAKTENGDDLADNNVDRLSRLHDGEPYRYLYSVLFPEMRASSVILNYDRMRVSTQNPVVASDIAIAKTMADNSQIELTPMAMLQPDVEKPFYMSVKTNLLYDALLIPNIGFEFYLGGNFSLAANGHFAWWNSDRLNWYHRTYGAEVDIRYWLGRKAKEKPLTGHHIGIYGQAITYDFIFGKHGLLAGEPGGDIFDEANFSAGLEYGYSFPIAKRLNLDLTIGAGYMWGKFYEYKNIDDCYVWQATKNRKWIGPTKAEVSLVWLIGRKNVNIIKKGGRR